MFFLNGKKHSRLNLKSLYGIQNINSDAQIKNPRISGGFFYYILSLCLKVGSSVSPNNFFPSVNFRV